MHTWFGGAVGVTTMHFVQQLKIVLFGWHVMQRQCYVEKQSVMKNYEEIKGKVFKLEFDASSNSFIYMPLGAPIQNRPAATLLFKPKAKSSQKVAQHLKIRKHA
jgi:hypothetical protein